MLCCVESGRTTANNAHFEITGSSTIEEATHGQARDLDPN